MQPPPPNSYRSKTIHVIGRYPPPIDGQSLATQSLADLLQPDYDIRRFNMTLADRALMPSGRLGTLRTMSHYLGLKPKLQDQLSDGNPVLWVNISSQPSGHWRDLLTVMPCLRPAQPLVAVVHWGNFSQLFTNGITGITAKRLIHRLNRVVVLSHELARQVARWVPADKLLVIPNYVRPLATEDELRIKRQNHSSSKILRVLFLSHMIKEKGCYDLLHGVSIAVKQGLSVEAHFAGRWNDNRDEGRFHRAIIQLGLTKCITVHGPISDRALVAKLHRKADVFALPSVLHYEAQPLAIMEALSTATPVIITKRPVLEALVGTEQGAFLVPPHNPDAIAKALQSLSDEKTWLNCSVAVRRHYETAYSPEAVRQLWINLIEDLST
ncbi:MAG: glycosyltransferase [Rhodothermaceae bacterium]|nr:glycosyltransferase [Bacteroidota bacterium]MXW15320.1 glycosyltransferase [Rhodothermaceae bacterium]MXW33225.1 glycosyltransferase [Rhodothermaceae bacterium]MYC03570.1 glycosyltransferase [Rhodothermaceae bacterium]MYE63359.1 glycosyltransferase [Rhodothermaceae bacterium]